MFWKVCCRILSSGDMWQIESARFVFRVLFCFRFQSRFRRINRQYTHTQAIHMRKQLDPNYLHGTCRQNGRKEILRLTSISLSVWNVHKSWVWPPPKYCTTFEMKQPGHDKTQWHSTSPLKRSRIKPSSLGHNRKNQVCDFDIYNGSVHMCIHTFDLMTLCNIYRIQSKGGYHVKLNIVHMSHISDLL